MSFTSQNWYFRLVKFSAKISYSKRFEKDRKTKEGYPFNETVQYHQD